MYGVLNCLCIVHYLLDWCKYLLFIFMSNRAYVFAPFSFYYISINMQNLYTKLLFENGSIFVFVTLGNNHNVVMFFLKSLKVLKCTL